MTAVNDEIDWNWVMISEKAPSSCENAIADWVIDAELDLAADEQRRDDQRPG